MSMMPEYPSERKPIKVRPSDDPILSGKIVRVINPDTGADINCEEHLFGKPFVLRRGTHIDVDEIVAKSAKHLWGFLRLTEVAKEEAPTKVMTNEENANLVMPGEEVDKDYEYPESIEEHREFNIDLYSFSVIQQVAKKLSIPGYQLLKKDNLKQKVLAMPKDEILKALKTMRLPVYFI